MCNIGMNLVSPTDLFNSIAETRIKLLNNFYSDPEVIQTLCNILTSNNSYVSSYNYNPVNNSLQIQLRKVFLKKFEEPNNSMSFYSVFNDIIRQLFNYYKDTTLASALGGQESADILMNNHVEMLYNITRISTNTVILYL